MPGSHKRQKKNLITSELGFVQSGKMVSRSDYVIMSGSRPWLADLSSSSAFMYATNVTAV
jgi:hypothetical protein